MATGADGTPAAVKVLYVAGSGRSGSTILDRTLGQVEGFFSAGELCNLWGRGLLARRRCGCGTPVPDCPVWGPVLAEAFGGADQVDARRLATAASRRLRAGSVPGLLLDRRGTDDDGYQAALARLYRAVAQQTGCRVIVDSSKSPVYTRLVAAIQGWRWPSSTWCATRGRPPGRSCARSGCPTSATTASCSASTRWSTRGAGACGRRRPSCCGGAAADGTSGSDTRTSSATRSRPSGASSPWPARPRPRPFSGPATVRMTATHSVSGNPNRFGTGEVELRADEEWRGAMRAVDRAMVTALTWPLLLRYRYPLRPPRG